MDPLSPMNPFHLPIQRPYTFLPKTPIRACPVLWPSSCSLLCPASLLPPSLPENPRVSGMRLSQRLTLEAEVLLKLALLPGQTGAVGIGRLDVDVGEGSRIQVEPWRRGSIENEEVGEGRSDDEEVNVFAGRKEHRREGKKKEWRKQGRGNSTSESARCTIVPPPTLPKI
jgi:hypothetical protein